MPITEDRIAKLREFGLSEYAARAYLALLDLGVSEARDISTLSKVPTSKIYHVLEQLHEKGLVEILPEFPKRYGPIPFQAFLEKVLQEHQKAVSSLEEDWESLVETFSLRGDVDLGVRGTFSIVRGRRNILVEMGSIVASAEREVLLFATEGMVQRSRLFQAEIAQARARGVRVRLIAPVTKGNLDAGQAVSDILELRHRDADDPRSPAGACIAIADSRRAFIAHFIPDDQNVTRGEDTAITTDDPSMVTALRGVVEDAWARATPFPARRDEILTGRPARAAAPEPARAVPVAVTPETLAAFWPEAQEHVVVSATGSDLLQWAAGLRDAAARGARLRVLTEVTPETLAFLEELPDGMEVRHVPRAVLRAAVADGREAFFATPRAPADAGAPEGPWVVTSDVLHLATLSAAFETAWQAATPFPARAAELASLAASRTPGARPGPALR